MNRGVELGRGNRIVDPAIIGLVPGASEGSIGSVSAGLGLSGSGSVYGASETGRGVLFGAMALQLDRTASLDLGLTSRNNVIHFNIRENGVVTQGLCRQWLDVRQSDGTPLPEWLRHVQDGEFAGTPPQNVESIQLKVIVHLDNGQDVTREITLDLKTGEITPVETKSSSALENALFSRQLTVAAGHALSSDSPENIFRSLL
jgi:hypothetical protein